MKRRSLSKSGKITRGSMRNSFQAQGDHQEQLNSQTNITLENYDLKQATAEEPISTGLHRSKRSISTRRKGSQDELHSSAKRSKRSKKVTSVGSITSQMSNEQRYAQHYNVVRSTDYLPNNFDLVLDDINN